jgi:hypothetical protein
VSIHTYRDPTEKIEALEIALAKAHRLIFAMQRNTAWPSHIKDEIEQCRDLYKHYREVAKMRTLENARTELDEVTKKISGIRYLGGDPGEALLRKESWARDVILEIELSDPLATGLY